MVIVSLISISNKSMNQAEALASNSPRGIADSLAVQRTLLLDLSHDKVFTLFNLIGQNCTSGSSVGSWEANLMYK
jgi:hypothetical protein